MKRMNWNEHFRLENATESSQLPVKKYLASENSSCFHLTLDIFSDTKVPCTLWVIFYIITEKHNKITLLFSSSGDQSARVQMDFGVEINRSKRFRYVSRPFKFKKIRNIYLETAIK